MEKLNSIISKVTVYSDRAQITRKAKISLPKGEHTVVFANLPENIEQKSIQVKGNGDAILNDIKFKQIFHTDIQNQAVKDLVKKIEKIKKDINTIEQNINIEQKEFEFVEKIIDKITHVAEKESVNEELNPEKWIKMVDFYRQKNETITKKINEYNYQKIKLLEQEDVCQSEINSLGNDKNKTSNQVEVVVTNNSDKEILFSLTYIVYGASWTPFYDIRVASEEKNVVIEYKAQIEQNTGESWENVKLSLSTAQVNISGNIPELRPWRIKFYEEIQAAPAMYSQKKSTKSKIAMNIDDDFMDIKQNISETSMEKPKAEIKTGATSVLFEIQNKCTIENNNQEHKVNIIIEELSAELTYTIIPKLSQYAYLTAKIKNTSEYPFLAGECNVFLDGSFVATSNLKLIAPSEEFETSLGVDEGIKVDYKLIKKYEKNKGLISKKNNIMTEYQTIITNNKKNKFKFILQDQLPISEHEDIKVELIEPKITENNPNLKIDKQKKIEWIFELEAGDQKAIDFIYSVEIPKNSIIDGF